MKAIILNEPGGTDRLKSISMDLPTITDEEVLIQVKAISINPVDVKTRAGKGMYGGLNHIKPLILGWDVSGTVTQVGNKVTGFKAGDEVFGMVNFPGHGKAYAEYVAAPASHLAMKPVNISHAEAAATTLVGLTAYQALVHHAKLKAGQRVLIHSAAGGVGHMTVQIAKYLGAYVIGTSSAHNKAFVLGLGADEHLDYTAVRFEATVSDMDFVLDTMGSENFDRSLEVAKAGGTVISIPSGLSEASLKKAKDKKVNGYNVLVQSSGQDMKVLAQLLKEDRLKTYVSQVFSFDEMDKAHQQIESGHTVGKVVIEL